MKRAALGMFVSLLLGAACAHAGEVQRARWLMGTLFTAQAAGGDTLAVGAALDAALDHVAALEDALSNWRETSELSRLNNAGASEALSEPLGAVLDSALALARFSGGAFDATVEPLTRAYDLRGRGRVPTATELAAARAAVGSARVMLDAGAHHVALHGATLDLGGIAKGFALDRAAAVLAARGVTTAVLDAGGQRLLLGAGADVWVAHPEQREQPLVCVTLAPGSLATSAQSERARRVHGRRIGHVLDPRTGLPCATRASVSVFAASGTRADALSTALLVLGRDGARAFAAAHPELGVLWLEPAGHRVQAHAWNLVVKHSAPVVDLVHDAPAPSLARIP